MFTKVLVCDNSQKQGSRNCVEGTRADGQSTEPPTSQGICQKTAPSPRRAQAAVQISSCSAERKKETSAPWRTDNQGSNFQGKIPRTFPQSRSLSISPGWGEGTVSHPLPCLCHDSMPRSYSGCAEIDVPAQPALSSSVTEGGRSLPKEMTDTIRVGMVEWHCRCEGSLSAHARE